MNATANTITEAAPKNSVRVACFTAGAHWMNVHDDVTKEDRMTRGLRNGFKSAQSYVEGFTVKGQVVTVVDIGEGVYDLYIVWPDAPAMFNAGSTENARTLCACAARVYSEKSGPSLAQAVKVLRHVAKVARELGTMGDLVAYCKGSRRVIGFNRVAESIASR